MNAGRPARLIDIAREAGVSKVAAGKVLLGSGGERVKVSSATAERIREIAQRLDYRPNRAARQLAGKGSHTIGVVLPHGHGEFVFSLIAEIGREAATRGYRLLVAYETPSPESFRQCVDDLVHHGVDAILCQHRPDNADAVPYILARHQSTVFLNRAGLDSARTVGTDRAEALRLCVRHLARRGCRRIGMVLSDLDHFSQQERKRGYEEELAAQRLSADPRLLWVSGGPAPPTASDEEVSRAVEVLVGQLGADAIVGNNDYWGAHLIRLLRGRGCRVPDDVAVIGYGNLPFSSLVDPALTTIDPQQPAVAARALDALLALIEGREAPDAAPAAVIQPQLIVRESA